MHTNFAASGWATGTQTANSLVLLLEVPHTRLTLTHVIQEKPTLLVLVLSELVGSS